jgi:hypothetical protein
LAGPVYQVCPAPSEADLPTFDKGWLRVAVFESAVCRPRVVGVKFPTWMSEVDDMKEKGMKSMLESESQILDQ